EPAEGPDAAAHRLVDGLRVGHVTDQAEGVLAAEALDLRLDVEHADGRARRAQRLGRRAPDAAGAAGHERDLPAQRWRAAGLLELALLELPVLHLEEIGLPER